MNLFVRCHGCSAIYKVMPDQLKIGEGWLRCGQCQLAFDSTGLVLAWPEKIVLTSDAPSTVANAEQHVIDEPPNKADQLPQAEPEQVPSVLGSFETALTTFKPLSLPDLKAQEITGAVASRASTGISSVQALPATLKSRRSKWLKLSATALSLGLLLQWVWLERQVLAASDPLAAKLLHAVCLRLGCDVLPLQVGGGIAIESSSLLKQDNNLQLNWSLRNVTSQTLQMPALELTLLNAEDKALVRRTLSVAEISAPDLLVSGEVWKGQLNIFPQGDLAPSGYRLLNFYP